MEGGCDPPTAAIPTRRRGRRWRRLGGRERQGYTSSVGNAAGRNGTGECSRALCRGRNLDCIGRRPRFGDLVAANELVANARDGPGIALPIMEDRAVGARSFWKHRGG